MKRKSPYLLLELLIAFTILAFSALLFIQSPLLFLQDEVKSLEKIEMQRVADVAFGDIKAKLYSKELKISPKKKGVVLHEIEEPIIFSFKGIAEHRFKLSYLVWTIQQKKGQNLEDYKKVGVKILFSPIKKGAPETSFSYELFLETKS